MADDLLTPARDAIALRRFAEATDAIDRHFDGEPALEVLDFDGYRAHIDIDGNTNSWPGLFQKLLSGSPVLKVASERGFRQWYYDRLAPWENYVPVAAGMGDLAEKARWLLSHDREARDIGRRGAALAEAMTYDAEVRRALTAIEQGLRARISE